MKTLHSRLLALLLLACLVATGFGAAMPTIGHVRAVANLISGARAKLIDLPNSGTITAANVAGSTVAMTPGSFVIGPPPGSGWNVYTIVVPNTGWSAGLHFYHEFNTVAFGKVRVQIPDTDIFNEADGTTGFASGASGIYRVLVSGGTNVYVGASSLSSGQPQVAIVGGPAAGSRLTSASSPMPTAPTLGTYTLQGGSLTTAGTAQQLGTSLTVLVCVVVTADPRNVTPLIVGTSSGVTSAYDGTQAGVVIWPGTSRTFYVSNRTALWINGATTGDKWDYAAL